MQLYEGINLEHGYEVTPSKYDQPDFRDLRFTLEDGTPYAIYLVIDNIYDSSNIAEANNKKVILVSFGEYGGELGDINYHRRTVPILTMFRILATVMKAVILQVNESNADAIIFTADKQEKENSRRRAYHTIAEQAAKYFDWRYMVIDRSLDFMTFYIFSPNLTEDDIATLITQNEDLTASTAEEAIDQAFEILDQAEILNEGISTMYWKNGGPSREQNKTTSFDDIESGRAGAEFIKGFDLTKKNVHYLGKTLGSSLDTRIAEDRTGGIMKNSEQYLETGYKTALQKMKVKKDLEHLDEFFNTFDEDVGMSTDFQQHAPEHMLLGSPIALRTGKSGERGLSKARRGRIDDDSWDDAYNKTISGSFLRENTYTVTKDQLPNTAANIKPRLLSKNVVMIVTDPDTKGNPVDVMPGPPPGFIAYGRGGVLKGQLWVDGGTSGSPDGHKSGTTMGFYWGVTKEDRKRGQRVLFLRGRNGATPEQYEIFFRNNMDVILKGIFSRIPPVR